MCLSRLPSIVQMRCCPVQLNAVYKYSVPIDTHWQKLKQRQREGKTERERERERLFTRHALISTKLSLGFREGRTVD